MDDIIYEIVGIEHVNYVSSKTKKQVNGYTLYCTYEKNKCDGVATESFFLSPEKLDKLKVGDLVCVYFNRFGSVQKVLNVDTEVEHF